MASDDAEVAHLLDEISELRQQADIDQQLIADLQLQGLVDRQHIRHLETGLETARRIGAAVGILMAKYKVSEDQAFAVLTLKSQREGRKVRDIADDVVLTGTD